MATTVNGAVPVRGFRPDNSKMYGLLHALDGTPIERNVRFLKVGIGLPTGPDVHVYMQATNPKWIIEIGQYDERGKRQRSDKRGFETKAEVVTAYRKARESAPARAFPTKFPYFTFLRLGIDGTYQHDLDAIEQHGPQPTELDLVFMSEGPFEHAYQYWTKAELKCEGNGIDARRRLEMASSSEEKELAAQAKEVGEAFFPILGGCYTGGCGYARPMGDKAPPCKPHGRLYFQLANSPRIGGSCSFDTSGFRSISQLFSCIQQIKTLTGRGDPSVGTISGIPLKLVLRPYKVAPAGKPSVQYGVSLEFRAENATDLARLINRHTDEFRAAARLIEAPGPAFEDEETEASALYSEFYGDFTEGGEDIITVDEHGEADRAAEEDPALAVKIKSKPASEPVAATKPAETKAPDPVVEPSPVETKSPAVETKDEPNERGVSDSDIPAVNGPGTEFDRKVSEIRDRRAEICKRLGIAALDCSKFAVGYVSDIEGIEEKREALKDPEKFTHILDVIEAVFAENAQAADHMAKQPEKLGIECRRIEKEASEAPSPDSLLSDYPVWQPETAVLARKAAEKHKQTDAGLKKTLRTFEFGMLSDAEAVFFLTMYYFDRNALLVKRLVVPDPGSRFVMDLMVKNLGGPLTLKTDPEVAVRAITNILTEVQGLK